MTSLPASRDLPGRPHLAAHPSAGQGDGMLRRLPVPRADPPYDDELPPPRRPDPGPGDGFQGTLALSFRLPSGLPATPATRLRLVAGGGGVDEQDPDDEDADFAPQKTPREQLPDPRGWSVRLVQALVEVLAGDRPVGQLVRWTSEDVYAATARQARTTARRPSHGGERVRPVVRSVHVSEPVDGVAEACALVQRGARSTAVALRLEGVDGRWRCTALEMQ